jgi:hypothetical protein
MSEPSDMEEVWKQIPGYGLHYEASSLGRIRSKERVVTKWSPFAGRDIDMHYKGKILKPCRSDKWGHLCVHIGVGGKTFNVHVARLVLLAFSGEPSSSLQARHLDGNPANNKATNLAWGTQKENNRDRHDHGRYAVGEAHRMSKITESDVEQIRSSSEGGVDIAKRLLIGTSQVSRIRARKGWKHV